MRRRKIMDRVMAMAKADWESKRKGSRHYAIRLAQMARDRGELQRPSKCGLCGKRSRVDGHHEDYAKPLQVLWLCRSCHRALDPFGGKLVGVIHFIGEILHIPPEAAVLAVGNREVVRWLCTLPETPKALALRRLLRCVHISTSLLLLYLDTKELPVVEKIELVRSGAREIAALPMTFLPRGQT